MKIRKRFYRNPLLFLYFNHSSYRRCGASRI